MDYLRTIPGISFLLLHLFVGSVGAVVSISCVGSMEATSLAVGTTYLLQSDVYPQSTRSSCTIPLSVRPGVTLVVKFWHSFQTGTMEFVQDSKTEIKFTDTASDPGRIDAFEVVKPPVEFRWNIGENGDSMWNGFQAMIVAVEPTDVKCVGESTEDIVVSEDTNWYIASEFPHLQSTFLPPTECVWQFKAPPQGKLLKLSMLHMMIPQKEKFYVIGKKNVTYTGTHRFENPFALYFDADVKFVYSRIPRTTTDNTVFDALVSMVTDTSATSPPVCDLEYHGKPYEAKKGSFTNIRAYQKYNSNQDCIWYVTVPPHSALTVVKVKENVEACCDKMEISAPLHVMWSRIGNNTQRFTEYGETYNATFAWSTDASVEYNGFYLEYNITTHGSSVRLSHCWHFLVLSILTHMRFC